MGTAPARSSLLNEFGCGVANLEFVEVVHIECGDDVLADLFGHEEFDGDCIIFEDAAFEEGFGCAWFIAITEGDCGNRESAHVGIEGIGSVTDSFAEGAIDGLIVHGDGISLSVLLDGKCGERRESRAEREAECISPLTLKLGWECQQDRDREMLRAGHTLGMASGQGRKPQEGIRFEDVE